MDIYLVGGAVRDRLLGRPVTERDYLVVGATPQDLLALGFQQVGRDFPVFLHPETRAEHALARTARRAGRGGAPVVHADPGVSLREDLARRDLTINALAEDAQGRIIDYFGGLRDLEQRRLRHVSPAFAEDPVRVPRVARFMARYAPLGFQVADETLAFMADMIARGCLDNLVPERVWAETVRALGEAHPTAFLETLRACGALARLFPELERLWGVPQRAEWHPEIDTGAHLLLVVEQARRLSPDPLVVFAALTHDLGKGATPPEEWPRHHGHEERGVALLEGLCQRLRVPVPFRDLARLVARYHGQAHRAEELRPGTALRLLEALDAFRRPERLEAFLLACEADYRGRLGCAERPYPQAERLRTWWRAAAGVRAGPLLRPGQSPEVRRQVVAQARIQAMRAVDSGSG